MGARGDIRKWVRQAHLGPLQLADAASSSEEEGDGPKGYEGLAEKTAEEKAQEEVRTWHDKNNVHSELGPPHNTSKQARLQRTVTVTVRRR